MEWGCPCVGGNGFPVELLGDKSKRPDASFKVGDETCIKVEEADKGVERLASGGKGPFADQIEFGGSRAVPVCAKVESNPLNSVEEEVAFLGVEGEAPFGEDVADARKIEEKSVGVVGE